MKKYLNTPEEVIKALKEGKEVREVREGTDNIFKLIDGIVVCIKNIKNDWLVNPVIAGICNPYIEEAEPLKFEVGKFYKMRDGEKALLVFIGDNGNGYCYKFVSQEDGSPFWINENGLSSSVKTRPWDIIGEWED